MKSKLTKAGLTLGFIAALTLPAFAQQTSPQGGNAAAQQGETTGRRGHRRHGRRGHKLMRVAGRLNLTDAQREQFRSIAERAAAGTKAQRDELRNLRLQERQGALTGEQQARFFALRAQLRAAKKNARAEMLSVLTTEQRAQLEAMKAEGKAGREAFRQQRQENRRR